MFRNYWVSITAYIAAAPNSIVQQDLKAINVVCMQVCMAYYVQRDVYPTTTACIVTTS